MQRCGRSVVAFVFVLMAFIVPGAAWAQGGTLDQSNEGPPNSYAGDSRQQSQTFTAGRTGLLDRVEVNGFVNLAQQATIQITAVDQNGVPTGPALGSGTFNAGDLPIFDGSTYQGGWAAVSISPAVPVVAGTQYAIVKPEDFTGYQFVWTGSTSADLYPQGKALPDVFGANHDFLFRTYVVAAPSTPNDGAAYTGTLAGTSGGDVLVGTEGRDSIDGRAGNDTICGLGGNDTIEGAAGDDTMIGGAGADKLNGASGTDTTPDFNAAEGDKRTNVP